jgi:hypothetical protein
MSASRIELLSLQNRQHRSLTSFARYLADDSTIQAHLPRRSNSFSLPGCGATTRTADQSKDVRKKHWLNENPAADICGRTNNFIQPVSCDSCSQRIIRRSTIQAAEGVPGHLERQNRTAAEDTKSSDLVAWTLEPEGEKFTCLNSVESLAARTPEVYLRWLWPRGQEIEPVVVRISDVEIDHQEDCPPRNDIASLARGRALR